MAARGIRRGADWKERGRCRGASAVGEHLKAGGRDLPALKVTLEAERTREALGLMLGLGARWEWRGRQLAWERQQKRKGQEWGGQRKAMFDPGENGARGPGNECLTRWRWGARGGWRRRAAPAVRHSRRSAAGDAAGGRTGKSTRAGTGGAHGKGGCRSAEELKAMAANVSGTPRPSWRRRWPCRAGNVGAL